MDPAWHLKHVFMVFCVVCHPIINVITSCRPRCVFSYINSTGMSPFNFIVCLLHLTSKLTGTAASSTAWMSKYFSEMNDYMRYKHQRHHHHHHHHKGTVLCVLACSHPSWQHDRAVDSQQMKAEMKSFVSAGADVSSGCRPPLSWTSSLPEVRGLDVAEITTAKL